MELLTNLCQKTYQSDTWPDESEQAFMELFGSKGGRFPSNAENVIQFRTPKANVPFAAIIHETNPTSGGYSGMSFVIFPIEEGPAMIAMVIGTQGLNPDAKILGKPGHGRKLQAITQWLNQESSQNKPIAWAKRDPVRNDIEIPATVKKEYPEYKEIFDKYGNVIYAFCVAEEEVTENALKAFLDFNFSERGFDTLSPKQKDSQRIKKAYFDYLLPKAEKKEIIELLSGRKYLILQGPPGTGKTRLANKILSEDYNNKGQVIQFHPNITYENFIGGLFPSTQDSDLGLHFSVKKGFLLDAIEMAQANPQEKYLLVIDEINRGDLASVLGEAIYGLEPNEKRSIQLPYDFGGNIGKNVEFPSNLHLLGTMNTADRSISVMDIAIRRRFAFKTMWPDIKVVEEMGDSITKQAFQDLLEIFIDYAPDDSFNLFPGHSYFIKANKLDSVTNLKTNLVPLLEDYLSQGYVNSFSDQLYSYLQKIHQLSAE